MRFLVLGATGMAGHMICIYLKEQGHSVVGYSRRKVDFVESIIGNVRETKKLQKIIQSNNYDVVINAVGLLNQFAENDKESAVFINGYLPHFLAKITKNMQTQIIHISTDCVFSGSSGPYEENAIRDGESFYDRSKAIGELEDDKNLTLRNSIIGPDMNKNGIGLFNWFMQQSEVNGYTHVMWTGLTTLQLAKIIEAAAFHKACGLINMVYKRGISKYDLLVLFNHYIRNDEVIIHPYCDYVLNKTLIRTNFNFNYLVPDYEIMMAELAQWLKIHYQLYPHYYLGKN